MIKVRILTDDSKYVEQEINKYYLEKWIEDGTLTAENEVCSDNLTGGIWQKINELKQYQEKMKKTQNTDSTAKSETIYAGRIRRLLNYIIDIFVMQFFFLIIVVVSGMFNSENSVGLTVLWVFLDFIYYVLLESLIGQTIGKMITSTRVIMVDGSKPEFRSIIIRTLCRLIPFEPLSFLGSNIFGWHDSMSRTMVIKKGS